MTKKVINIRASLEVVKAVETEAAKVDRSRPYMLESFAKIELERRGYTFDKPYTPSQLPQSV